MLSLLVPESIQKETVKRLSKLAKKAGVEVRALAGLTTLILPVKYGYNEATQKHYIALPERAMVCARVEVGDMPRTNGWAFVARLEHTEAGNLVVCAPGEVSAEAWRTSSAHCDHCDTARRRKDTFMLRGPNGESKQIGRNCLADFLMVDATQLVAQADLLKQVGTESDPDYEGGWGGSAYSQPTTDTFLACVTVSVELKGFRKVNSEGGSTRGHAMFLTGPKPNDTFEQRAAREDWMAGRPTEAHIERAKMMRAWGAALTADETRGSDYLWNLHLACKLVACDLTRSAGILASLPAAYDRAMGIEHEKKAPRPESKHVGTVGKREKFEVTFTHRGSYQNDYGGGIICNFKDAADNELVWFTSGACPGSEDLQKTMTLTGTVKKHGDRKGQAQTVVSRCSWVLKGE